MTGTLSSRGVVVTGGNRGIGLGLARGVVAAGASVAIWGRDKDALASARTSLAALAAPEANVLDVVCDVSDEAAVKEAFATSVEALGPIHAAFANAGIGSGFSRFAEKSDEDWQTVMKVNLGGTIYLFRAAIEHMLGHGEGGSLIAVASLSASTGMWGETPYAASKAAQVSLIQTLAVEYARKGIRANAILPGWITTDMTADTSAALHDKVSSRIPVGRFGTPDDFGGVAAFLADPAQIYHTAQSVIVDGGYANN